MSYDFTFCNSSGLDMMGSDSVGYVDKRKSTFNCLRDIASHKESYRINFPHKWEAMTYVKFRGRIHKVPQA